MNKMMSTILSQTEIITAKVEAIEEDYYILSNRHCKLKAKKALSCMFEISLGDIVMATQYDEKLYIVSLLESQNSTTANINADTINLNANKSINSFAKEANIVISKVSILTKLLSFKTEAVNFIANSYNGIIDTLTLKNRDLHHSVEGHIEQQMRSSRRVVEGSDIHQVQESITTAEGQVKIDAEQVNIA